MINMYNVLENLKKEFPYIYYDFNNFSKLNDMMIARLKEEPLSAGKSENLDLKKIFSYVDIILKSLGSKYYDEFCKLKQSGAILIDNLGKTRGSYLSADGKTINFKYTGSYFDIATLIHEFVHYLNRLTCVNKSPLNRQYFGETMAISFELYAQKHLITSGIPKNLVGLNIRYDFERMMVNYYKNTIDELKIIWNAGLPKTSEVSQEEIALSREIGSHFQHLLGFLLGYYITNNFSLKDIIYLNNHLNDFESPKDIFMYLKINLETLLLMSPNMSLTLDLDQRKNTDAISII